MPKPETLVYDIEVFIDLDRRIYEARCNEFWEEHCNENPELMNG